MREGMEIPLFARVSAHGTISFVAQLRTPSFCLPFRRRAIGCTNCVQHNAQDHAKQHTKIYIYIPTNFLFAIKSS